MPIRELTPEIAEKIIEQIKQGVFPIGIAAMAAGVDVDTFREWTRIGMEEDAPELYARFVMDIARAEILVRAELLKTIHENAKEDWHAAAWLLERQKVYGGHITLDGLPGSGEGQENLQIAVAQLQRMLENARVGGTN